MEPINPNETAPLQPRKLDTGEVLKRLHQHKALQDAGEKAVEEKKQEALENHGEDEKASPDVINAKPPRDYLIELDFRIPQEAIPNVTIQLELEKVLGSDITIENVKGMIKHCHPFRPEPSK